MTTVVLQVAAVFRGRTFSDEVLDASAAERMLRRAALLALLLLVCLRLADAPWRNEQLVLFVPRDSHLLDTVFAAICCSFLLQLCVEDPVYDHVDGLVVAILLLSPLRNLYQVRVLVDRLNIRQSQDLMLRPVVLTLALQAALAAVLAVASARILVHLVDMLVQISRTLKRRRHLLGHILFAKRRLLLEQL